MGGTVSLEGKRPQSEDVAENEDAAGPEDRSASDFAELFEVHHLPAFRLALLICGGETTTAEDAVSEAFARVFQRWKEGGVDDFGPYLRRSVVNQVKRTMLRRMIDRRAQPLMVDPSAGMPTLEDEVLHRQFVWGALRALPPRQRTAVVLRYYEALSLAEIAQWTGTTTGTAKAHLSRGRQRLRELLDEPT
jgi:RNA polymerase sigma factor (sigma-70 family)